VIKLKKFILLFLCLNTLLFGKLRFLVSQNYSSLTTRKENYHTSFGYGLMVEKNGKNSFINSWSFGVNIIELGGVKLNCRTDHGYINTGYSTSFFDFFVSIKYLQVPFNLSIEVFNYYNWTLKINSGMSFLIPVKDNSRLRFIKTYNDGLEGEFGYHWMLDPPPLIDNSLIGLHFGIRLDYRFLNFQYHYSLFPNTLSHISSYEFHEKLFAHIIEIGCDISKILYKNRK